MKKDIRKQLHRMTFVVVMLLVFAIWQHEFVLHGVYSNVFLNSIIIGTFVFGMALTFKSHFELNNELISFHALQESYNDLLRRHDDEADPYWRFRRCKQPAIVFEQPRIMWQAYFLISDEMSRTGDLKLSASTMQTLIDGIDAKLDDQRSLNTYITGLLVFLGLIGTFVGLMVTLASVGKIISDLDLSGAAGTASVQRLLENLKEPLQGMATGFSSSLFGLVTSLALGLIARFQNSAASSLKLGFEAWLSSVVHITDTAEQKGAASATDETGQAFNAQHLRLMYNVAKYSLTASNRTNRLLDKMTAVVSGLGEEQNRQGQATEKVSLLLDQQARYQALMTHHLGRTADALSSHDDVAVKLREVDLTMATRFDEMHQVISQTNGNLEQLNEELIRMSQQEEVRLDRELEGLMTEIDENLSEQRQQDVRELLSPVDELRKVIADSYAEAGK